MRESPDREGVRHTGTLQKNLGRWNMGVKGRQARRQGARSRSPIIPGLASQFREVGFYTESHGRHLKVYIPG